LLAQLQLSSSTVTNHINDIIGVVEWYILFQNYHLVQLTARDSDRFYALVKAVKKNLNKQIKRDRSMKSIGTVIQRQQWPVGGLVELQQVVRESAAIMMESEFDSQYFDSVRVKKFFSLLFASFWVTVPNGRVSGMADMKLQQGNELIERGFATSDVFKTFQKYGLQAVIVDEITTLPLLRRYISSIRPAIVAHYEIAATDGPQSALWLNPCTGTAMMKEKIGISVVNFFKKKMGLKLSITTIRSVVETSTDNARQRGIITSVEQNSVQKLNGHSSAVVKDFYLRQDVANNVSHGRKAFTAMSKASMNFSSPSQTEFFHHNDDSAGGSHDITPERIHDPVSSIAWPDNDLDTTIQWGSVHPYKHLISPPAQRVPWTAAEINWIRKWCGNEVKCNPSSRKWIVSKCLRAIVKDPDAIPIFHAHHTFDSGRLRSGYQRAFPDETADK
jgi:hypothetical protein